MAKSGEKRLGMAAASEVAAPPAVENATRQQPALDIPRRRFPFTGSRRVEIGSQVSAAVWANSPRSRCLQNL